MRKKVMEIVSSEILKMQNISISEYSKIINILESAFRTVEIQENEEFLQNLLKETRPRI